MIIFKIPLINSQINRRQFRPYFLNGYLMQSQEVYILAQNKQMLFDQQITEDKGLFTFYRQQAEHEETLKRERRLRKKKILGQQLHSLNLPPPPEKDTKKIQMTYHYLLPTTNNNSLAKQKHPSSKPRQNLPKQRLVQSVVDMGKDIGQQPQTQISTDRTHLQNIKLRQPAFVLKSRRYREKINQILQGEQNQGIQQKIIDQIQIQSMHACNRSEELLQFKQKPVIHSVRGSVVGLPQIKKTEDVKVPYKPKKSLKSKLIQQAMHSRDKQKIKQIRNYMKSNSPFRQDQLEPLPDNIDLDQKSFAVFQFRQQKLMGILKKFHKGV